MSQTLRYTCDLCGSSKQQPVGQAIDGFARVCLWVLAPSGIPGARPAKVEALWCHKCCAKKRIPYQSFVPKDQPQPDLTDLIREMVSEMVAEEVETAMNP